MKRIQYACLEQTIHFESKTDIDQSAAANTVKREVEGYKSVLERKKLKYKIEEEKTLPDGSVVLKIKRQYNAYDYGDYLQ